MIIVFIDSIPFGDGPRIAENLKYKYRMIPILGYSVNVKSTMFGAGGPDTIGVFNEWNWHGKSRSKWILKILELIDKVERRFLLIRRIARRLLVETVGINIKNIPLAKLALFSGFTKSAYDSGYPFQNIFEDLNFRVFTYSRCGSDKAAFREFIAAVEQSPHENYFLGLADLDHVQHLYGQGSMEYDQEIQRLSPWICQVQELIDRHDPRIKFLLCSDHGMSEVTRQVDPTNGIEKVKDDDVNITCFVDATMVRFWGRISSNVIDQLEREWPGRFLSNDERSQYEVTNAAFGSEIFVLNVGNMFVPSDVSSEGCMYMHGYRPEDPSQFGLVSTNFEFVDHDSITASELQERLRELLS